MLTQFFIRLLSRLSGLRRLFWYHAYQLLSRRLRGPEWLFMNYGWTGDDDASAPDTDRLCAQLYQRTLGEVKLAGRDVLEVGCGRGGGSAWMASRLAPASVTGVDISPRAIAFCKRFHTEEGLTFQTADAEDLPFEDASFDVILNVESSHCYGDCEKFLAEVHRVLRPGGWFCWADVWATSRVEDMLRRLDQTGMTPVAAADLTDGVLRALELASPAKEAMLSRSVPRLLHPLFRPFMGLRGTSFHRGLSSGALGYFCRVYRKPPAH